MREIHTIPFNKNFIEEIIKLIYREGIKDYSNIAIVFPGRRPFLYLQKELSSKIKSVFYPPKMFGIDDFIDYVLEKKIPDMKEMQFLDAIWILYSLWEREDWDFSKFYPWGVKLLDFINQIDIEDVENSKLKSVEENAEIGFDIPDLTNQILKQIVSIRENFHKEMDETHCFTRGYRYFKAKQIIEEISFDVFDKIYFAGLFGLTKTEKTIINKLFYDDKAEIINVQQTSKLTSDIKIYSAYDTHSLVVKTHQILKQIDEIKNTCIVLPNPEVLFPLLTFAVDRLNKKDFNISLPYPLNRTSLYSLLKEIINCQLTIRVKDNKINYYTKDYLNVITNPFIKNLKDVREEIQVLQDDIRDKALPFINLNEITLISEINKIFFQELEDISNLFDAAGKIEKILDYILEYSPIRSFILSGEVFNLFFKELFKIKKSKLAKQKLSNDEIQNKNLIWNILIDYFNIQKIPFETKPLQDLEIIGFLETRNLNFDNVIILNVEEGVIPDEKIIDPLVPIGLYEQLGLPSTKNNEEIYRYNFYRLIQGSKNVHLLYIESEETHRSRYIEEIIWNVEKQKKKLDVLKVEKSLFKINLITKREEQKIEKDEIVHNNLMNLEFSPSSIDAFLQCQFKFYYENVLKIKKSKEITDDIEEDERGKIIHEILKDTFFEFKNEIISSDLYNEIYDKFQKVLINKLKEKVKNSGEYYIFEKIAKYKLGEFLKKDINSKKFRILELEERFPFPHKTKFGEVKFIGKVDRIDYFPDDDEYIVIDYKTASKGSQKTYSLKDFNNDFNDINVIREKIKSFQLPMYVFLYHKCKNIDIEKINGKIYYLGNLDKELLFDEKTDRKKIIFDYYFKALNFVIDTILSDEPFVIYEDRKCDYCQFTNLCPTYLQ